MKTAYRGGVNLAAARNALDPSLGIEMVRKVVNRIRERRFLESSPLRSQICSDVRLFCRALDPDLWIEAEERSAQLCEQARKKLSTLDYDLGGPAHLALLYFFVRYKRPRVVVETGVAAGFSSTVILSALAANGGGRLYSSDLPYFRLYNPEQYIGYVVPDELKLNWSCLTKGDRQNLPKILSMVDKIDLFHHDSDKMYHSRMWAMKQVAQSSARMPRLS